jgi:hypothetical protein
MKFAPLAQLVDTVGDNPDWHLDVTHQIRVHLHRNVEVHFRICEGAIFCIFVFIFILF